jgi:hypothetical protein
MTKEASENEEWGVRRSRDGRQADSSNSLSLRLASSLLLVGLLGEELGENVGEDTTLRDDDVAEELVELLVVADGKLKVTGDDTRLLVVTGGVTGKLEDLGGEVLKDGGEVDGGTRTDALGVVALLQETVDTTNGDCRV